MNKSYIYQRAVFVLCLILLFAFPVQSTFGYILTHTESIKNIFIPFESNTLGLTIYKSVQHPFGSDYIIPDNINFDFKVSLGNEYAGYTFSTTDGDLTADDKGELAVCIAPNREFCIEGIDIGTKINVTEVQNRKGFNVKDGVNSKEITVSDDGTALVSFVNIYSPESVSPSDISINGTKTLSGRTWQEGDSFTFLIEYCGADGKWISLDTKTVAYDANNEYFNKFSFTETVRSLEFDNIGEYKFRISEIPGNANDIIYDNSVACFNIAVTDTDMDGKLEISSIIGGENSSINNNTVTVEFCNKAVASNTNASTTLNNTTTVYTETETESDALNDAPPTGDDQNILIYIITSFLSIMLIILQNIVKKQRIN